MTLNATISSQVRALYSQRWLFSWPLILTKPIVVFLRVLEYYKGILFLTTNRIGVFDKAFKSRIHLAIHFPALSCNTRFKLWNAFITKASVDSAELLRCDGSLDQLAREEVNGRQIKNIVRTAFALAISDQTTIQLEHITTALEAMKAFEESFDVAQGKNSSENDLEQGGGQRADDVNSNEEIGDGSSSYTGRVAKRPRLGV